MDKRTLVGVVLVAAFVAGAGGARAQAWSGDVNFLLAGKKLDYDDWHPVDRQFELGLQSDFRREDWPVSPAIDLLASGTNATIASDGFTEERGRTSEVDLGVRKIWRPDAQLRPYVGGGLALVSADLEFRGPEGTITDHDGGAGLWLGGGAYWTLSRAFNLGLDAKLSHANVRLFGRDRNAGGFHLGMLLGYHWGP